MILVTGGIGYIGSHTCVELIKEGYEIAIVDNLINSNMSVLNSIEDITGKEIKFYKADIRSYESMKEIFSENSINSVIHFAGLKSVGESNEYPLMYYDNNVNGTINLCEVMKEHNVKNLIFSSSATVYGDNISPMNEDMSLSATNPYGYSKLFIEQILKDLQKSDNSWSIVLLRYFNPLGAHESGKIGEEPLGVPNNIFPYISQVAAGKRSILSVFGDDYDTVDGTGVRDYIHVVDLAKGHIKAMKKTFDSKDLKVYNLGTGRGYSVLELIETFERVNNVKVPYRISERRKGDIDKCYADVSKSKRELDWETEKSLEDMCRDIWRFQLNRLSYEEKNNV